MSAPSQPTQFGPYVLDRKLAVGGMAEVFLAHQVGIGGFEKQVVVKRILPALSTSVDFVEMFLNEARLAARLNHGNVVQVIEAGEIDGRYYMAMEYIDGVDLKHFYDEATRTGEPTPPGVACRIIADLLAGLHYAHTVKDENGRALGIVHRDVSPQNVLITRNGTVKIVDFGIAKATNAATQQTRIGQVKGKISYLSPEQAMGKPLDARSDVFACGILLWELVTGARLFSRPNDMAAIMAITDDEHTAARSIRKELPEALDHVLRQALARPLTDRYPSAQAMQTELEALIRSQGWAGDRRTLERHMQQKLGLLTPHQPLETLPDPELAGVRPTGHDQNATLMGAAVDSALLAPPPASNAATVKLSAEQVNRAALVAAAHAAHAARATEAPYPTPGVPRTPSGMRMAPPGQSAYPPASGTGRRVVVIVIAALFAGALAIGAMSYKGGDATATPVGPAPAPTSTDAIIALEVSEPAIIELDGRRTRVDAHQELPMRSGSQVTLTATTVRGHGAEATRTISLPPASAGERMPLKLTFPK